MSPEAQASAPHAEGPHEKRLILQRPPQCGGSYAIRIGIVGVGATGRSLVDFRRRTSAKKFYGALQDHKVCGLTFVMPPPVVARAELTLAKRRPIGLGIKSSAVSASASA